MKTILTGVKPTGTLHLGNYFGAIKPAIQLGHQANAAGDRHIMFVANYHALNYLKDTAQLNQITKEVACAYLACGLNPEKSIFYRQSDVPEIFELTTILTNYTPKGLMNKSHAYKAAVDKNHAKGNPTDAGINMGLYDYPLLMAADILTFRSDEVPVGKDQVQHVEIAQDIAGAMNAVYGQEVLKIPAYVVQEFAQVLPGTDGRKMSKSYGNVIPLFGTEAEIKKAVMGIQTDCQDINAPKNPEEILLFHLVQGVADESVVAEVREGLEKGGMGYGTIKKMLLAEIMRQVGSLREAYMDYMLHYDTVQDMLNEGAKKARAIAAPNLAKIKEVILG